MARTVITETVLQGASGAGFKDLTWTIGDTVNDNYAAFFKGMIVIVMNTNVGAQTVDLVQVADSMGRIQPTTNTLTLAAAGSAGDRIVIGPLIDQGWNVVAAAADDGMQFDNVSHIDIEFAVLRY